MSRTLDPEPVETLDQHVALGGGEGLRRARGLRPPDIIDELKGSGLRGRGGAGFPTGVKWETVAAATSPVRPTPVVVNAAEGEPGTFKDRALLRTNPYRVLEGALVAAEAMAANRVVVGIKHTFEREIGLLERAVAEVRAAGWLEATDVEIVLGPSSYLFGEETALLEVIEGRQPFPRVTPPFRRGLEEVDTRSAAGVELASEGGTAEAPVLVDNVETLANVALIAARGPEWFRELGTERSPGTVVCTVSGATPRSGVGELPMGATIRDAIESIGGGHRRGHPPAFVLSGTANPLIPADLFDTPMTYEALAEVGSGLGSAGFIVFDRATDPLAVVAGVARFLSVESCGQCEPCKRDGRAIAELLRRALSGPLPPRQRSDLGRRLDDVAVGARCNLARQEADVPRGLLALMPDVLTRRPEATDGEVTEPVEIAPILEMSGGRAVIDRRQLEKQPDWSYGEEDSGTAPAARLGNTPVHLGAR